MPTDYCTSYFSQFPIPARGNGDYDWFVGDSEIVPLSKPTMEIAGLPSQVT